MVFFGLFVFGCASGTFGSVPTTDRLQELEVGVSTVEEVRAVLGVPRGTGASRITPELGSAEILVYDYHHALLTVIGIREEAAYLLVFVKDGRYVAHTWFSTLEDPKLRDGRGK